MTRDELEKKERKRDGFICKNLSMRHQKVLKPLWGRVALNLGALVKYSLAGAFRSKILELGAPIIYKFQPRRPL